MNQGSKYVQPTRIYVVCYYLCTIIISTHTFMLVDNMKIIIIIIMKINSSLLSLLLFIFLKIFKKKQKKILFFC